MNTIIFFISRIIYIDGFMPGEQYPGSYNDLVKSAFDRGLIKFTGCPDRASPTSS